MGFMDTLKTKLHEAAEKAGPVAEQAKDKVSDLMEKRKSGSSGHAGDGSAQSGGTTRTTQTTHGTGGDSGARDMVSEGAPVSQTGEAAPGAGDDGTPAKGGSDSGMTQTIGGNVASGDKKADEKAERRRR